jgi:excisionase family DNA binding protein
MSSNLEITKICLCCGKEYTAKTLTTRYCSHDCNRRHYKKMKREEKINNFNQVQAKPDQPAPFQCDILLQQKQFLSIDETALLIGASRRTIQRLISSNKLHVSKVGSRTIITRKAIDYLFYFSGI